MREIIFVNDCSQGKEIAPCCFTAFKRRGKQGTTVYVLHGMEIQVSFISDNWITAKGFNLTWTGNLLSHLIHYGETYIYSHLNKINTSY